MKPRASFTFKKKNSVHLGDERFVMIGLNVCERLGFISDGDGRCREHGGCHENCIVCSGKEGPACNAHMSRFEDLHE